MSKQEDHLKDIQDINHSPLASEYRGGFEDGYDYACNDIKSQKCSNCKNYYHEEGYQPDGMMWEIEECKVLNINIAEIDEKDFGCNFWGEKDGVEDDPNIILTAKSNFAEFQPNTANYTHFSVEVMGENNFEISCTHGLWSAIVDKYGKSTGKEFKRGKQLVTATTTNSKYNNDKHYYSDGFLHEFY